MIPADALHRLTVREAARAIAAGRTTSEALVRACLERIEAREPVVGAWAHLSPAAAIAAARERDRQPSRGPLHGVPIGIKDIMDTVDMPTAYGSPIYAGHQPVADAACVALLREAGAVILGKTVTTEFAATTPGRTANPHNPEHSPGGSSSGSAASVADFMVPAALGTQTVGSTIRPSSFCGAVGFKPTFGAFSLKGVHAQSESLDTLGIITRSVDDVMLLADVLMAAPGAFDAPPRTVAPRLGFYATPHWPRAEPATIEAMKVARERFVAAGAIVEDIVEVVHDAPGFERAMAEAIEALWLILQFEFSRVMAFERTMKRDGLSPNLRKLLDAGLQVPVAQYRANLAHLVKCRALVAPLFDRYDALFAPSAAGEAPFGVAAQTDLLFQRLWTSLRLPAITLPGLTGPKGLPVGVQLIGPFARDAELLAVARWAEPLLAASGSGASP